MKLEQLFPDFNSLSDSLQQEFFLAYHTRRSQDLLSEVRFIKPHTRKSRVEKLQLTDDELKLVKALGLKPKDLMTLMNAVPEEESEDEDEDQELLEEEE
jgi:hypothetical protein